MQKDLALYSAKVLSGVFLGILFGLFGIKPIGILDSLICILVIALVLIIITLLFARVLKIRDTLIRLFLLYGTFWYVLAVLGFWALILNI